MKQYIALNLFDPPNITSPNHNLQEPLDIALIDEYNQPRISSARNKLCHAPFKNIYFGTGDRASACCLNRDYLLGNYPEQSIKEIWGGEVKNLRTYIEKNDLSRGCQICNEQLKGKNFDGTQTAKWYKTYMLTLKLVESIRPFYKSVTALLPYRRELIEETGTNKNMLIQL